jgi:hypothetical protein
LYYLVLSYYKGGRDGEPPPPPPAMGIREQGVAANESFDEPLR